MSKQSSYKVKQLLLSTSILTLMALSPAYAAQCASSQSRSVSCTDYNGRTVADSYCRGSRPGTDQGCTYSCPPPPSSPPSSSSRSSTGGGYVDVNGDGVYDTPADEAPPGDYRSSSTQGSTSANGRTEVSTWGGNVSGSHSGGIRDSSDHEDVKEAECFVTTAVVNVMGEADNGPTLSKLRHLRDDYTRYNNRGADRIGIYYDIAPSIVRRINAQPNSDTIWRSVHEKWIKPIAQMVDNGDMKDADNLYSDMVFDLSYRFLMDELTDKQKRELFLHVFKIYPSAAA